ncbi:MAG: peptidoglycan-binding domain-containing protein [Candidatus Omnitrophica bacterium]|jgi:murein L,D-transpeptidase YcbB/YkuD|nr:peptidoglycan-binding protein [Candidatus Omnitrophota bacterium]MDD5079379.1 peptidoglycan-binding domain-containing protein [Candidatus Omnitrophota bacterium]
MRKYGFIILVLALGISLGGCSKNEPTLEELQQPMSPEDLNRLKTETIAVTDSSADAFQEAQPVASVISTTEAKMGSLPPSGPYKPAAKEIQSALRSAGYYGGSIDGKLGPKSKKAIEEFQAANSLTVDGKVGPKTWSVLSQYMDKASAESDAQGGE